MFLYIALSILLIFFAIKSHEDGMESASVFFSLAWLGLTLVWFR